jgi:hypothetical protein
MMKTRVAFAVVACLLVAITGRVIGADDAAKEAEAKEAEKIWKSLKCPVSGKAISKDAVADYLKGKVYFCCEGCPEAFAKDVKKFATKANHQLVATKQYVQKACPLSGRKIADEHHAKVSEVAIKFCCPNCKGAVEKLKGDEQMAKVFEEKAFEKGFEPAKKDEDKKAA